MMAFVLNTYWSQATWFVDPQNSYGVASDSNTGLTSGAPLLTWGEIVGRWGTISPRLRQTTTITFLSSHTDNTDPIYFRPFVENGSFVSIRGNLGASQQIATGVLGTVTAKNRATPQLLKTVLPAGAYSAGMLIVNATHSSRAWLYTLVTGTTWNISQPLVPNNPAAPTASPAEVDTWTVGDTVTVYQPVAVNIADFSPELVDLNASTFNNLPLLYQLTIFDPGGAGDDLIPMSTANTVDLMEIRSQRVISFEDFGRAVIANGVLNCYFTTFVAGPGQGSGTVTLVGGVATGAVNGSSIAFNSDIILGAGFATTVIQSQYRFVYLETSTVLQIGGGTFINIGVNGVLWGPGSLNIQGNSRMTYPAGAGAAAALFQLTGGIQLNGQTGAWLVTTGATPTAGKTLSAANLDTDLGATTGAYLNPGGASISNGGT